MKYLYIWRVIRDLSYSASAVYIVYYIISTMTMDRDFSLGEMFFVLFLLFAIIFVLAEIEDERKPRRFTVKID